MQLSTGRVPVRFPAIHRRQALFAGLTAAGLVLAAAAATPASASPSSASSASASSAPAASASAGSHRAVTASSLRKVRHVWVIELENTSYQTAFGHPSSDPELAKVLPSKGALLKDYYGIGHDSLDNYIAEISGQAPDFQTGQDCEYFSPFLQFGGENFDKWTKYGQLSGDGCVYPSYVHTLASQLTAENLTWKSYNQQMGANALRDGTTLTSNGPACGHPKLGTVDQTDVTSPANDSYATRHNPFVYFEGIIGNQAYCDAHVVSLQPLQADLGSVADDPELLVDLARHLRRRA